MNVSQRVYVLSTKNNWSVFPHLHFETCSFIWLISLSYLYQFCLNAVNALPMFCVIELHLHVALCSLAFLKKIVLSWFFLFWVCTLMVECTYCKSPHCLEAPASGVTLFGGTCFWCHTVWWHLLLVSHCLVAPASGVTLFGGTCFWCHTVWRHLLLVSHCLEAPASGVTLFGGTCFWCHTVWRHLLLVSHCLELLVSHLLLVSHCLEAPASGVTLFGGTCLCLWVVQYFDKFVNFTYLLLFRGMDG